MNGLTYPVAFIHTGFATSSRDRCSSGKLDRPRLIRLLSDDNDQPGWSARKGRERATKINKQHGEL